MENLLVLHLIYSLVIEQHGTIGPPVSYSSAHHAFFSAKGHSQCVCRVISWPGAPVFPLVFIRALSTSKRG
ncbi:unnamed protein product [Protopolystoma xenopodis]|uniref:Secreted protein n=1 Tax=Protopolystoma xenopodis TaxID=117903 RepID=A0A448XFP9_9PLAT|nr:unnamed protein product [Protopolystoma xenopodis]